jgi:hypothetical protein
MLYIIIDLLVTFMVPLNKFYSSSFTMLIKIEEHSDIASSVTT